MTRTTRQCIVNVDDFGISLGVNRGILEAHHAGVVTSASLMVDGEAVDDAVAAAHANRNLSVGLHVCLTEEDGTALIDLEDEAACQAEVARQLRRFDELMGRPPTHLDSHHHVHRRAAARPVFVAAAERLGVPLRGAGSVAWVGDFYGAWDDESHPEQISLASLDRILMSLAPGVTEVSTHVGRIDPTFRSGYREEREIELATILDPRLAGIIEEQCIELIGFADLEAER
jgi:predicted glycoside hydrolase/deacetylase ChbG (UPF0249 family)